MGGGGEPGGGAAAVMVNIRCSNGSKLPVETALDATVGEIKAVLAGRCDMPAEEQRLIYKGRVLKDDQTLQSYGVESGDTIHLVRGVASAKTASPNLGASGTPNSTSGLPRSVGSTEGGDSGAVGFGGTLFPGLGTNGPASSGPFGLFGTGSPEIDQMQQQLSQNPGLLREIINMPIIQNLMNNPEVMRNIIMSNPQIRAIMERNPELAHVLNDPSTLRQTLEAARNPELMREMMRNTDRAMSNIESSPEGFNMLRRMYENVQEPFLNAATMTGDTRNELGSNPFAALLGNQGGSQSRDGMQNSSTTTSDPTTGPPAPNTSPLPNPWSSAAGGAQPTSARSAPTSEARASGVDGLGGSGIPDLERMIGGMQDPSFLSQFMQNPAVGQLMQSILSDPQYMNQILSFNPQMRGLLENSQFRELLQNPEFLRQLTSPDTIEQLLTFQRIFLSNLGRQTASQGQNQPGGGTGSPNMTGMGQLLNLFGGLGASGLGVPNTSNVPPEELYATQLSQLQEMGFYDTQENIRALSATAGNVHAAVERLLGNLGQ